MLAKSPLGVFVVFPADVLTLEGEAPSVAGLPKPLAIASAGSENSFLHVRGLS
ncbi:hypothetical protein J2W96_002406 [Variovorax guangxiensis]|nr:hypothetical protein [Variovorax guangxiensis]